MPNPKPAPAAIPTMRRRVVMMGLLLLAYLYPFPYHPHIQNPNENVRLFMTAAIAESGKYAIDDIRDRWGWVNDAAAYDGKIYSVKAPGTSLLAVPAYWLWFKVNSDDAAPAKKGDADKKGDAEKKGDGDKGAAKKAEKSAKKAEKSAKKAEKSAKKAKKQAKQAKKSSKKGAKNDDAKPWEPSRALATWICRFFGSMLPMAVFFWFLYPWLGRRTSSPVIRDAIWWSLSLGSCLYAYALLFVSHAVAAACGFGALMLLMRGPPSRQRAADDPPPLGSGGVFAAGLLAASVTAFEYPGFVVSVILCLYGAATLGSWRRLLLFCAGALVPVFFVMHFHNSAFGNPWTPGHLHMEDPNFRAVHHHGFFGADRYHPDAAKGLLYAPGYGLLPGTPIFIAAAWGFIALWWSKKSRSAGIVAFLCAAAAFVLSAFLSNWRGGWTVGPRYISWIYPMLAWAALVGLDRLHRIAPGIANGFAIGALLVGLIASGVPAIYYPHVPEVFLYPLGQLFGPLMENGFAAHNALNHAGVFGTESVIPMAAIGGVVVGATSFADRPWRPRFDPKWLIARAFIAPVFAAIVLRILVTVPDNLHPHYRVWARDSLRFVTTYWSPAGKDDVSRLHRWKNDGALDIYGKIELAERLHQLGHLKEAKRALRDVPDEHREAVEQRWRDMERAYRLPKPPDIAKKAEKAAKQPSEAPPPPPQPTAQPSAPATATAGTTPTEENGAEEIGADQIGPHEIETEEIDTDEIDTDEFDTDELDPGVIDTGGPPPIAPENPNEPGNPIEPANPIEPGVPPPAVDPSAPSPNLSAILHQRLRAPRGKIAPHQGR